MNRGLRTLFVSLLALSLSAATTSRAAEWIAWRVPTEPTSIGDSHCPGSFRQTTTMVVAVLMDGDRLDDIRLRSEGCPPGVNARFIERDPEASVAFLAAHATEDEVVTAIALHDTPSAVPTLEKLADRKYSSKTRQQAMFWLGNRGGERGFRFLRDYIQNGDDDHLRSRAVFALSQSDLDETIPALIDLARHGDHSVRKEAVFWLGQRAGEKAAGELKRIATDDEDDDIREHAVFAISQLPRERSVPILIDLVKTHKSTAVRKKAMFWLAQTGDPRAIELMEEILTKK